MEIKLDPADVINEMQARFPRELELCVQAVQIKKLSALLEAETPGEQVPFEVVEDADVPG